MIDNHDTATIDYPAKRKIQRRLHPVIFLIGWIAIITFGWIVTMVGIFEMMSFLPQSVRLDIRWTIPFSTRYHIKYFVLICVAIGISVSQWYWLNRGLGLRLSRWFIVVTFVGRSVGALMVYPAVFIALNTLHQRWSLPPALIILPSIAAELTLAFVQWWMLRSRWQAAWLWIVAAIIAGIGVEWVDLAARFDDIMHYGMWDFFPLVKLWIPVGIAHGIITGVTAIMLDRLTRRDEYPPRKKHDFAG